MTRAWRAIASFFARSLIGVPGYALLGYVTVLGLVSVLFGGGHPGATVVALGAIAVPAAAAAVSWSASKREGDGREVWVWRMFAGAFLVGVLARIVHTYVVAVGPGVVSGPSAADAVYLFFYPFALTGVFLAARRGSGTWRGLTSMLDGLIFTLGVAGLWWWVLFEAGAPSMEAALAAAGAIASPAGDILILFALASLYLGRELDHIAASALFLLLGFFVAVGANLAHTGLVLTGGRQLKSWDVLWCLAIVLMSLSPLIRLRASDREPGRFRASLQLDMRRSGRSRHLWMVLPYLAFPAAAWLLYLAAQNEGGNGYSRFVIVLALSLLGLVMLRQFLTLVENNRLGRSLVQLSRELEERVAARTEELTRRTEQLDILNHVATFLSRGLTTDAVLTSGIALAVEASGSRGGVVWLLDGDRSYAATHQGLAPPCVKNLGTLVWEHNGVYDAVRGSAVKYFPGSALGWQPQGGGDGPCAGLLLVPLVSRGVVLGALGLVAEGGRPLEDEDLQLQQSIGAQLGIALENARQYDTARYLADRDSVTGLFNHRSLHERLENELKRAHRTGGQFALVMMDLDNFKLINDTYGHPVGDEVLREVADRLAEAMRGSDVVGRYGGDEFMMILPDTGTGGAVELAERLRQTLKEHPFAAPQDQHIPIHLSFGVATYPDDGRRSSELVGFADANLYLSKKQGGDRITVGENIEAGLEHVGMYDMLEGLITAVDSKDHYTRSHSDAVTAYALDVAHRLALSEEQVRALRMAGLLHDVGKIGIPDAILRKPGRLTPEEYEVVKGHPLLGELIVKEVPHLEDVMLAVGSHHERYDGTGYPRGLKGEEIPLLGRILAVADAFSAMTADRPYRRAKTREEACRELQAVAGTQLDPLIVAEFLAGLSSAKLPAVEVR